MRSWAQRTARWTVKTVSFGRAGGEVTGSAQAGQCPLRADERGTRHHPMHERGPAAVRGRHAAPRPSRKARMRLAS